jgi:HSP20 family protein
VTAVRQVGSSSWPPWDLLAAVGWRPIVVPTAWRPATDVCETPESLMVTAELAGVLDEDIEIALYRDALVVDGVRRSQPCGTDAVYLVAQIRDGAFHLEVPLAVDVDAYRTSATFENGILLISLPKLGGRRESTEAEGLDR